MLCKDLQLPGFTQHALWSPLLDGKGFLQGWGWENASQTLEQKGGDWVELQGPGREMGKKIKEYFIQISQSKRI